MKPQALIVDDEQDARGLIALYLERMFPQIEVIGEASSLAEAQHFVSRKTPDILFLDIELPDGTGFDLLPLLEGYQPLIIFITAFDEYAIKAIRASAQDYILKPINNSEFATAVKKVLNKWEENQNATLPLEKPIPRIALPSLTGHDFIDVASILYCEADNNYTTIHLTSEKTIVISKTLAHFETQLNPYGFLRIHHRYLVNLKMIRSYAKGKSGGHIVMNNGQTLTVSLRKKHLLLKHFTI